MKKLETKMTPSDFTTFFRNENKHKNSKIPKIEWNIDEKKDF